MSRTKNWNLSHVARRTASVVPMPLPQWGIVLGLAVTPLVVCEIEKAVRRARTGRPVPVGKEAAVYR